MRAAVGALCLACVAGAAPEPSLREVLKRSASYVEQYHRQLEAIVAEERYVQRSSTTANSAVTRTLRSDFMLLPGGSGEPAWFAFRDVFEVDGDAVESSRGRLEGWLAGSRSSFMQQARALALEQARYNVGPIVRTINVPTLALEILMPHRQDRFRFRQQGTERIDGADVHVVTFEERRRPTLIRTPEGRDLPASGRLWIEPASGRVLRTELRTGQSGRDRVEATIRVSYAHVARLELWLPAAMTERYVGRGTEILCTAIYSNFRRFETDARIIRDIP
jgi:hypothetical protein